jgi:peroxiredoxin
MKLRFVGALAALIGLAAACGDSSQQLEVGDPFPEVVLTDIDGNRFRLSEHRGNVIVLNFWATWCPPCVEEMPSLQKLHERLGDKGLEVVAVSVDESPEDIEAFSEQHGLSFTILHDRQSEVSHSLQTFKYPETYVVDSRGNLAEKIIGPRDWIAPKQIQDFLSLLDSGSPGSEAQSK